MALAQSTGRRSAIEYTWPGSSWRPSACEADVIATRPQVLNISLKRRELPDSRVKGLFAGGYSGGSLPFPPSSGGPEASLRRAGGSPVIGSAQSSGELGARCARGGSERSAKGKSPGQPRGDTSALERQGVTARPENGELPRGWLRRHWARRAGVAAATHSGRKRPSTTGGSAAGSS